MFSGLGDLTLEFLTKVVFFKKIVRLRALTRNSCVNSNLFSVPGGFPLTRTIVVNSILFTVPIEFEPDISTLSVLSKENQRLEP